MKRLFSLLLLAAFALLVAGGCSKNKNAPDDVISLKDAKAKGPVRPTPEMRARMKAAINKSTTAKKPRRR